MMRWLLIALFLVVSPAWAAQDFAKRYPNDNALEVYTPNNPPPAGGPSGTVNSGTVNLVSEYVGVNTVGPTSSLYAIGNNVGVNTANPQNILSIGGNAAIGAAYSTVAAPSNGLLVQGNVGIGTSAPGSNLSVLGSISMGGYAGQAGLPVGSFVTTANVGIGTINATTGRLEMAGSNDIIYWRTAGTGGLTLNNSGPVYATLRADSLGSSVTQIRMGWNTGGANAINPVFTVGSNNRASVGTVNPSNQLSINGAVGIGTANSGYVNTTTAPAGGMIVEGNVGLGTFVATGGKVTIGGSCLNKSGLPLCVADNAGTIGTCPTTACLSCNPC